MWHEEYPETYLEIKSSKMEVERQSIIHEIAQSHRDFYDDLQHVKAVRDITIHPFCIKHNQGLCSWPDAVWWFRLQSGQCPIRKFGRSNLRQRWVRG